MVTCPKCKHRFPESQATRDSFELFHVIRDAYARATAHNNVYAKDELCVLYGVAMEYAQEFVPPKWPGVFCKVWDRGYFRKSTLAYTKDEMARLIERSAEAVYEAGGELPVRGGENV